MPRHNHKHKPAPHQRFQMSGGDLGGFSQNGASFATGACPKKSYPSQQIAERQASTQMLSDFSLELNAYHCQKCGQWHLTSKHKF